MKKINFVSQPVNGLRGEVMVPGDKSISHRSVIFGAIAEGTSHINGFLDGEDCLATIKAFQAMGVSIEGPIDQKLIIHGVGKHGLRKPHNIIDCGNSGTTIRLLSGLMAAQKFDCNLTGDASLQKRPMARVCIPLSEMGARIMSTDGKPPLNIRGGQTLHGIVYAMPEASAQVKSCLLLAGLYARGTTTVIETGITRDHTERMLKTFSYPVVKKDNRISVESTHSLMATTISIPGDISSAAFLMVAATIIPDSSIVIKNVGINPTRIGIIHILQKMGANISIINQRQYGDEPIADLSVCYSPLQGITIPEELVPLAIDEFPVIFVAAACAKGITKLHGAKELRAKESDRIGSMVTGLKRLGIDVEAFDDGVHIIGGTLQGGEVDSFDDHRIAMSFAIAGAAAKGEVTINDCLNVNTSFPNFVKTANSLQLSIKELEA